MDLDCRRCRQLSLLLLLNIYTSHLQHSLQNDDITEAHCHCHWLTFLLGPPPSQCFIFPPRPQYPSFTLYFVSSR